MKTRYQNRRYFQELTAGRFEWSFIVSDLCVKDNVKLWQKINRKIYQTAAYYRIPPSQIKGNEIVDFLMRNRRSKND